MNFEFLLSILLGAVISSIIAAGSYGWIVTARQIALVKELRGLSRTVSNYEEWACPWGSSSVGACTGWPVGWTPLVNAGFLASTPVSAWDGMTPISVAQSSVSGEGAILAVAVPQNVGTSATMELPMSSYSNGVLSVWVFRGGPPTGRSWGPSLNEMGLVNPPLTQSGAVFPGYGPIR